MTNQEMYFCPYCHEEVGTIGEDAVYYCSGCEKVVEGMVLDSEQMGKILDEEERVWLEKKKAQEARDERE